MVYLILNFTMIDDDKKSSFSEKKISQSPSIIDIRRKNWSPE